MAPPTTHRTLLQSLDASPVSRLADAVADDSRAVNALVSLAVAAEQLVNNGDDPVELTHALGRLGLGQGFASVALWLHVGDPSGRYRVHARWRAATDAVPNEVDLNQWGMGGVHDSLRKGDVVEVWRGDSASIDTLMEMHRDEGLLLVPIQGSRGFWGAAMFALPEGRREPWTEVARSCLRTVAAIAGGSVRRSEEAEVSARMRQALQASRHQEEMATLAVGVAHDLGNLLTSLRGRLDLARHRELVAAETSEQLNETLEAATALVRQLYTFAGLEERPAVPVDLLRLWRRGLSVMGSSRPPGVQVLVDVQDDLPRARGDVTQIGQALGNLVLNAFEALRGQEGTVVLGGRAEDREGRPGVRVWIRDDGPGVPEAVRGSLFEPMVSTRGTRRGLGLAAARNLARHLGGNLWLDPGYTDGASFEMWLPAWTEADEAEGTA